LIGYGLHEREGARPCFLEMRLDPSEGPCLSGCDGHASPPRYAGARFVTGLLAYSFNQERDSDKCAPLVEVLSAQPRGDHVDGLDVAQRLAGVFECGLNRTVRAVGRASDDLDDLRDSHV